MERTTIATAVFAVLVCCGVFAGVAVGGQHSPAATADQPWSTASPGSQVTSDRPSIVVTSAYRLRPSQPGRIEVRWMFEVPQGVSALNTSLLSAAERQQSTGFERTGDGKFVWRSADQSTRTPSLTFTVPVNQTRNATGPIDAGGRFTFVDAGDWALIQRQRPRSVGYRGTARPTVEYVGTTAGPGAVGSGMVFLGPHRTFERSAHGQTFELVVPEAASLGVASGEILQTVTAASDRLRIGDRDERVLMIAAPTTVPWAVRGLQTGAADFYVLDDQPVDDPDNVWLHEYVHTRQNFDASDDARWFLEAGAEYYANLLTLEQGRIDFQQFREHLDRATNRPWYTVRLTAPATWQENGGNYFKGSLVAGGLDRQLREATNGSASLQRVLSRLNHQEQINHTEFLDAVETAGGADVRAFARKHTETTSRPSLWAEDIHRQVFGSLPALFSYEFPTESGAVAISGTYRNQTYAGETLVRSESLTVPVTVTNVGGANGTYDLTVTRNREHVVTRSAPLDVGANATENVTVAFNSTGEFRLSTGDDRLTVLVRDPASLTVTNISASRLDGDGGQVQVTVTVENRFDRPGNETIVLTRDGTELRRDTLRLNAGESTTLTATTALGGGESAEFRAGNATLQVTAGGGTPGASGPGFGLLAGLLAVVLVSLRYRVE